MFNEFIFSYLVPTVQVLGIVLLCVLALRAILSVPLVPSGDVVVREGSLGSVAAKGTNLVSNGVRDLFNSLRTRIKNYREAKQEFERVAIWGDAPRAEAAQKAPETTEAK